VLAIILSYCPNALDVISSLNSVILPCVTMIIICEFFLASKLVAANRTLQTFMHRQPTSISNDTAWRGGQWIALGALAVSWLVGIATSGVIPQLKFLNAGVWILYAWFTSFTLYGVARVIQIRKAARVLNAVEHAYQSEALDICETV
jgi:hypothetical protein